MRGWREGLGLVGFAAESYGSDGVLFGRKIRRIDRHVAIIIEWSAMSQFKTGFIYNNIQYDTFSITRL